MRTVPPIGPSERDYIQAINQLIQGRHNAGFTATLTAGTTTVLTDPRINGDGWIRWIPLDSAAAALIPNMWLSSIIGGQATISLGVAAAGTELFAWIPDGG